MPNRTPPKPGSGDGQPIGKQHDSLVRWTRAVAFFTGLLFAANAGADFFIYQQWRTAADAQVDTREQLRASISVQPYGILVIPVQGKQAPTYGFIETFQNVGGTRTEHFSGWLSVRFFEGDIPNNIDLGRPATHIDVGKTIIGPNSVYQIGVAMSAEDAERFAKKDIAGKALLWGEAEYSDIFDPNVVHTIQVCSIIVRPFEALSGNSSVVQVGGPPDPNHPPIRLVPYQSDCNKST